MSAQNSQRRLGKRVTKPACILFVAAIASASVQLGAQSKPCGTAAPPPSKSWKIVPCDQAPEPSDNALGALRRARGQVFDDTTGTKKPEDLDTGRPGVGRGRSGGTPAAFPPLPVSDSDSVIVGRVRKYQPYFSNDRTAIYHELTIEVEEVLYDKTFQSTVGETVAILGEGGSLRLADGRVYSDFVPPELENDIRVGGRYVLFLVYRSKGDYFGLLKAWELRDGRAVPMALSDVQKAQKGGLPLAGMSESGFLEEVRNAVCGTGEA